MGPCRPVSFNLAYMLSIAVFVNGIDDSSMDSIVLHTCAGKLDHG